MLGGGSYVFLKLNFISIECCPYHACNDPKKLLHDEQITSDSDVKLLKRDTSNTLFKNPRISSGSNIEQFESFTQLDLGVRKRPPAYIGKNDMLPEEEKPVFRSNNANSIPVKVFVQQNDSIENILPPAFAKKIQELPNAVNPIFRNKPPNAIPVKSYDTGNVSINLPNASKINVKISRDDDLGYIVDALYSPFNKLDTSMNVTKNETVSVPFKAENKSNTLNGWSNNNTKENKPIITHSSKPFNIKTNAGVRVIEQLQSPRFRSMDEQSQSFLFVKWTSTLKPATSSTTTSKTTTKTISTTSSKTKTETTPTASSTATTPNTTLATSSIATTTGTTPNTSFIAITTTSTPTTSSTTTTETTPTTTPTLSFTTTTETTPTTTKTTPTTPSKLTPTTPPSTITTGAPSNASSTTIINATQTTTTTSPTIISSTIPTIISSTITTTITPTITSSTATPTTTITTIAPATSSPTTTETTPSTSSPTTTETTPSSKNKDPNQSDVKAEEAKKELEKLLNNPTNQKKKINFMSSNSLEFLLKEFNLNRPPVDSITSTNGSTLIPDSNATVPSTNDERKEKLNDQEENKTNEANDKEPKKLHPLNENSRMKELFEALMSKSSKTPTSYGIKDSSMALKDRESPVDMTNTIQNQNSNQLVLKAMQSKAQNTNVNQAWHKVMNNYLSQSMMINFLRENSINYYMKHNQMLNNIEKIILKYQIGLQELMNDLESIASRNKI